jgi:hypothetical protein
MTVTSKIQQYKMREQSVRELGLDSFKAVPQNQFEHRAERQQESMESNG